MTDPTVDPGPDHANPEHRGMRHSRRVLLVALMVVALGVSIWTSFRPDLDSVFLGVGWPNPVAFAVWFVLFVAALLQVSAKVRAFVVGLAFCFFWPLPLYGSVAANSLYSQFVTERVPATVAAVDESPGRGPYVVTYTMPNGAQERGTWEYTEGYGSGGGSTYTTPRVGTQVEVMWDPTGLLPPRTANRSEGTAAGAPKALALAIPGILGLTAMGAIVTSVLTRRASLVTVLGRPEPTQGSGSEST
ncbi:hypothetical protein CGZ95_12780 [Enemella evansiae]|uniref:hypothetical protein n=1 Tax=Enemella evansiae TaxID=2016499 RepID=UPI000B96D016|nr:hypothetical protein [Enemella evansiae]OYN98084.1 hypothetical protein CGZ95_12780 [Enemella evansiae]